MEVSWYCWVTVISLVTNFHGCLCWPTLQPPLRPVTSKHELDSDESRKVLGSSVVTSVSVIMDHGNGTKTFLTDGIENPELKTNIIGSPGNLLNPDRYEFYTFDETGDLVKRLMTWDEIQGLIAGGDGDAFLGESSVPMYYSDALSDKLGTTHLTANDFQTSDIQGVHKVVESVQNVLKSELAASQSKIPPVVKPGLISNAPNWSLFLPTLLDNAEEGSELNNLGVLVSPSALQSSTDRNASHDLTSATNFVSSSTAETPNTTESSKTTIDTTVSTIKEFTKKTDKPSRYKTTTTKPIVPTKTPFNPPTKSTIRPTTEKHWSTVTSSTVKKPFSTSKYGGFSSNEERWTVSSTPKKPFSSVKYGAYGTNDEPIWSTSSPGRKNLTTKYGSYSSIESVPTTTELPSTKKALTTSKYGGGPSTNNELFASIASVLQQVTDDGKVTSSLLQNITNDKTTSTYQYKVPTESNHYTSLEQIIGMNAFKFTTEASGFTTLDSSKTTFNRRPSSEFNRSTTEGYKTVSTEKKFSDASRYTTPETYKIPTIQNKFSETSNKFTMPTSAFQYKTPAEPSKHTTEKPVFADKFKTASASPNSHKTSAFSDLHKTTSPFSNGHRTATPFPDTHRPSPLSSDSLKTVPPFSDNHRTVSPFLGSLQTVSAFADSHKGTSPFADSHKTVSPISDNHKTVSSLQHKPSTEPNKYVFSESPKPVSAPLFKPSTDMISSTKKPTDHPEIFTATHKPENNFRFNFSDEHTELHTSSSNYSPFSTTYKDTPKSTKTYDSSTPLSVGHVTMQRQPLTTKPTRNKVTFTKFTSSKPPELASTSASRTQPLSSLANEKPLIRISTLPNLIDQTTTRPEPLVTWISTSLQEDTPSKVSLFGVYDSDKLVTEQYVSSSNGQHPSITDFFRNASTSTTKEPTPTSVSTEAYLTDSRQSTKQTNKVSTLSLNTVPSGYTKDTLSSSFESSRPFRPSERPESIESKTEPLYYSFSKYPTYLTTSESNEKLKTTEKSPTSYHGFSKHPAYLTSSESNEKFKTERPSTPYHSFSKYPHVTSSESTEKVKTSEKPSSPYYSYSKYPTYLTSSESNEKYKPTDKSSTPQIPAHNYTSSETVMQRIPTINPPSKSSSNTGLKASTKPQHLYTESTKNITQIAVMLNKSNETATKNSVKNEFRNKVTSKPTFDTTKPINALFINDCITSLISSSLKDNYTTESVTTEHPHAYDKLPASDQKENSHIYYYKLPPIASQESHIHFYYKPTEENTATASGAGDVQYYKPDVADTSVKPTTEKEYHKITTVNRPDDVIQEGISAVTNILLQTEGRVPNKEFAEFEAGNATRSQTTENVLPQLDAKNATKNATEETTGSASSPTTYKAENRTVENVPNLPSTSGDNTTEFIELTSVENDTYKPNNDTDVTTTEMATTESEESATIVTTTVISPDFRNEYVIDDRNITQEEEEDIKNYHTHTTANRTVNGFKNTTSSTPNYTEVIKLKTTTAAASKPTERSTAKPTTEKVEVKIQQNVNRSTIAPSTNSTTEFVEVKLENKTGVENKTEAPESSPPPSAFRSPSSPAHRLPPSTPGPGVELHPAPHESMGLEASIAYLGDDVKRFVDFCNELSFKIWTTQTGKSLVTSRSIVLSPFAVISTLAMIFLGARGSSSGIMNDFLKLDDMVTFNPHQVLQNITESAINPKNIGVANSAIVKEVFSDKGKGKVLDFYKERLQQYYDTHVEEINFNSIGDLVRRRTNLLVKRQTQGRIQDYLRGSALVLKPPLAVLTANIFQTDCSMASTEGRDGEMYFVVRPSTRQRRLVPIPAVVYRNGFLAGYEPGLDATAVTLNPESVVSTILVLPGQQGQVAPGDGLARLEQRLLESSYRRGAWSRLLRSLLFRPGLELQIPRFSHKSVLNLTAGLQKMGMDEIFASDKADLRGINGVSNELHLSDIVQVNTLSTCGETMVGARHHIETYPSSPQRVGRTNDIFDRSYLDDSVNNYYSSLPLNLRPRQARLPDNPRLRFDRPFLYIVRHNPTGMILYIGRFNPRLLP